MGPECHRARTPVPVEGRCATTKTDQHPTKQTSLSRITSSHERPSPERPVETSASRRSSEMDFKGLCHSKATRRRTQVTCRPFQAIQVHPGSPLQNEWNKRCSCTTTTQCTSCKDRSVQCLWTDTTQQTNSSLPSCQHWQPAMVATRDASRNKLCTVRFHKYNKNGVERNKEGRNTDCGISRRLHCDNTSNNLGRSTAATQDCNKPLHTARVQDKPSKNIISTNPCRHLPGHGVKHGRMDHKMAQAQKRSSAKKVEEPASGNTHTKVSGRSGRGTEGSKSSLANSAPRNIPTTKRSSPACQTRLGHQNPPLNSGLQRSQKNIQTVRPGDCHTNHTRQDSSNPDNRCSIIIRMGSHSENWRERVEICREMDKTAARQAFNRTRDESSSQCHATLPTSHLRLQTSDSVRLFNRRMGHNTKTSGVRESQSNCHANSMPCREAEHKSDMLPLSRSLKCCNRPAQSDRDPQWTCPSSRSICTSARGAGTLHCGCICNKNECQAATVHQLASRPRGNRSGLLLPTSGQERALLRVPSHRTSVASTSQDTRRTGSSSGDCSRFPRPSMDSTFKVGNLQINRSRNRSTSAQSSCSRTAQKYADDSLPVGEVGALTRAALSKSTWAKYDNAFRQWASFCIASNKSVPTATAQDFEQFLVKKAREVKTGVALREMRAGIVASAKLRQLDSSIYETDTANKIIQGAMRMQPQLPTLPVTFDAAEALRQAALRAVPLDMEMAKTMFLLMILGPWRHADVLAMRPSAIIPKGDAFYCALQTKGGRGEYEWRVVEPCDNKNICPVIRLKYLLSQQITHDKDCLWISDNGSPITNIQARNMVQQYMLHIGIGPEWSPHHCRAAGASTMVLAGVPYMVVARHGGWRSMENMLHFYIKTYANDDVSRTVEKYVSSPQH